MYQASSHVNRNLVLFTCTKTAQLEKKILPEKTSQKDGKLMFTKQQECASKLNSKKFSLALNKIKGKLQ